MIWSDEETCDVWCHEANETDRAADRYDASDHQRSRNKQHLFDPFDCNTATGGDVVASGQKVEFVGEKDKDCPAGGDER